MIEPEDTRLDRDVKIDTVTFVITPFDEFTGQPITTGVAATIEGLPALRPIKNLSGKLVFINIDDKDYRVKISAKAAGYFDEVLEYHPNHDPDPHKKERPVALRKLPSSGLEPDSTVVAGVVKANGKEAEGVRVTAETSVLNDTFWNRTDVRGAFALAMRLSDKKDDGKPIEENVDFTFQKDGEPTVMLTRTIVEGKFQPFSKPIDLHHDDHELAAITLEPKPYGP